MLKTTKRAYVKLVETLAMNGYDISEYLNPTYKNIDAQKCLDYVNYILEKHEGKEYWEYEKKVTLENI